MLEYTLEVKKTLVAIITFAFVVSVVFYLIGYSYLIAGFILGSLASMVYYLLIAYRVRKSAQLPVPKAVAYMRMGWLIRLAFIVLVLLFSVHYPLINFWSAVAGIFSLHAVMLINAVVLIINSLLRNNNYK